jgi:RNA polymerase sigma-70 factor (ECF subfamily)
MPSVERGRVLDEQAVVAQAQRGDPDAFELFVRRYEEEAFRVAYLVVRDAAEAQDVAQEAFVRAYRSLSRFDAGQPFRPWLLRIVTRLAINSRRGSRRRGAMSERYDREYEARGPLPSPEATAEAAEQARRVWQAVAALSLQEQELLYLRYFLDASEKEAAVVIGRPVGTVKSRLHRTLRRLREVIEKRYPDLAPSTKARDISRTET